MNRFSGLAPWQIIAIAITTLIVFMIGSYFAVISLTTTPAPGQAESTLPENLGGEATKKVVEDLRAFESPTNLPNLVEPLRTPDPNFPSSQNPFSQ